MNVRNLLTIASVVKNSNMRPTTKSIIGGVLKDMGGFDEVMYEAGAKEHNMGEMDLIAQLQQLLDELMSMENEEMLGEEVEAEYEMSEGEEDEGEEDEEDEGEEDEGEEDEGEEDEGEEDEGEGDSFNFESLKSLIFNYSK